MKPKYFYDKVTGLNADIKRHREHEERLLRLIAEAEGAVDRSYRNILTVLQASKAEVVDNIGRNKHED